MKRSNFSRRINKLFRSPCTASGCSDSHVEQPHPDTLAAFKGLFVAVFLAVLFWGVILMCFLWRR